MTRSRARRPALICHTAFWTQSLSGTKTPKRSASPLPAGAQTEIGSPIAFVCPAAHLHGPGRKDQHLRDGQLPQRGQATPGPSIAGERSILSPHTGPQNGVCTGLSRNVPPSLPSVSTRIRQPFQRRTVGPESDALSPNRSTSARSGPESSDYE